MLDMISDQVIMVSIILLLVCSVLCQIIIGVLYQNMIQEAENMTATENKLLKQCKLKFINCYELNVGVANIPVFVEKYLNKMEFGKIPAHLFNHLSGQLMLLSVFTAGVGICKGIIFGKTVGALLPYYIISLLGLYSYFAIASLVDVQGKRKLLQLNMVDYLENHMAGRLLYMNKEKAVEQELAKELSKEQIEVKEENLAIRRVVMPQEETEEKKSKNTPFFGEEEKKELDELLKEFFA